MGNIFQVERRWRKTFVHSPVWVIDGINGERFRKVFPANRLRWFMAREERQHTLYIPLALPVAGGLERLEDTVLKEIFVVTY